MPVIAFVGAGSAEFTQQLVSDLLRETGLGGLELHLMDPDSVRLQSVFTWVQAAIAGSRRQDVSVRSFLELETALHGAEYVITTILVGGREAVRSDFAVLRRYGIRQTVGDTLGIAGVMRGVRTVPVLQHVAQMMETVCPNAILLNYTNPMSMLVMGVAASASVEQYGLCHSVVSTIETLADYLGVPAAEIDYQAYGINHLAWLLRLERHGEDLYPALRERSLDSSVWLQDPVRFEMLRDFGRFATESSKHMAEYTALYIGHDAEVNRLNIPLYEYITRPVPDTGRHDFKGLLDPSDEYAAKFIVHRELQTEWSFQANVMNEGLIQNLPQDAAVEVPCQMVNGHVAPIPLGVLPLPLAALDRQAISVQQLTVWGVLHRSREAIYQAAAMDPQAGSRLTMAEIRAMVDGLLETNRDWVPAFT